MAERKYDELTMQQVNDLATRVLPDVELFFSREPATGEYHIDGQHKSGRFGGVRRRGYGKTPGEALIELALAKLGTNEPTGVIKEIFDEWYPNWLDVETGCGPIVPVGCDRFPPR